MSEMLKNLKKILLEVIKDSSKVFIVGHNEPDFDSISSSIGLWTICQLFGRKAYIIVDESNTSLEPGVRKIIDDGRSRFNIIDLNQFKQLLDDNSSLIVADTNKEYLLLVKDFLDDFKYSIVIDHHSSDHNTIDADYIFIDTSTSSASEIVARLLNSYHLRYDATVANYLLAGIQLDTNRYSNNTTSRTHNIAEKLIEHGANPSDVSKLFKAEFETDRRINNLIYNESLLETYERDVFQTRQVSYTVNRTSPQTVYKKEDLAKAADKMLDYNVDASFAIGHIDDKTISISARSKSDINVGEIMSKLNGGGNAFSGACKIVDRDIIEVENNLRDIVSSYICADSSDEIGTVTITAPPVSNLQKVKVKE